MHVPEKDAVPDTPCLSLTHTRSLSHNESMLNTMNSTVNIATVLVSHKSEATCFQEATRDILLNPFTSSAKGAGQRQGYSRWLPMWLPRAAPREQLSALRTPTPFFSLTIGSLLFFTPTSRARQRSHSSVPGGRIGIGLAARRVSDPSRLLPRTSYCSVVPVVPSPCSTSPYPSTLAAV